MSTGKLFKNRKSIAFFDCFDERHLYFISSNSLILMLADESRRESA